MCADHCVSTRSLQVYTGCCQDADFEATQIALPGVTAPDGVSNLGLNGLRKPHMVHGPWTTLYGIHFGRGLPHLGWLARIKQMAC